MNTIRVILKQIELYYSTSLRKVYFSFDIKEDEYKDIDILSVKLNLKINNREIVIAEVKDNRSRLIKDYLDNWIKDLHIQLIHILIINDLETLIKNKEKELFFDNMNYKVFIENLTE